ncbi:MAG: hypothetical protein V1734_01065 [Nanoarchaeota archaeon]
MKQTNYQGKQMETAKEKQKGIEKIFEIKINSSEANQDKGYSILRHSRLSIICLEDERYILPESALKSLKKSGVKYDILSVNGVPYAAKSKN